MSPILENILTKIAKKHFNIDTLETRKSDSLDMHNCAVWQIKEALQTAFNIGLELGVEMTLKNLDDAKNLAKDK
jgi:hypothetical protein